MKMLKSNKIYQGDCLDIMHDIDNDSIDTIITSPPYWGLRDYGVEDQIGLEPTLDEYHSKLLEVTAECKRVLKKTGTMFWVHGDSYGNNGGKQHGRKSRPNQNKRYEITRPSSGKPKCLTMQNYRLAIRMVDEQGWILRNILIWHKKNHMPSSVQDRYANAYEPVFFFSKSKNYWFDLDAIRVPYAPLNRWGGATLKANGESEWDKGTGQVIYRNRNMQPNSSGKNPGDIFTLPTQPFPEAHFAVFPEKLVEPFIKAGCPAEVCKHCGFIRERITERKVDLGKSYNDKTADEVKTSETSALRYKEKTIKSKTIGWTSCTCKDQNKYEPGTVLDPFMGAGTTAVVAKKLGRRYYGIELNPEYIKIAQKRILAIPQRLDTY